MLPRLQKGIDMKITNDKAKYILVSFIRSCTWLNCYNLGHQPSLDLSIIHQTRKFLATLGQQSEESWQALTPQEQDNILCEINLLFSQLSSPFYQQDWVIDENAGLTDQAISLLHQIFAAQDE